VTDPDLDLGLCPDDTIQHLINLLDRYQDLTKVGLSLEVNDLPSESPVYREALGWETPFWQTKRDWQCFDAPVDTTFAVYDRRRSPPLAPGMQFTRAVRSDRPFTARHLPFDLTKANITEEDCYYLRNATWSSTMSRYLQCLV